MSTKINADFYGAENTFTNVDSNGNIKRAASTLWDLLNAGTYTGGSLEQSAAPWGMGRSSASSLYCFAAANDNGAYARKDWYNNKGNTPLYMYYRSSLAAGSDSNGNGDIGDITTSASSGEQIKKALQTARYNLTTAGASNALNSTLSDDSGDNVDYAYCSTFYPVTYADYAKIRIYCGAVCYIPEGAQVIKYCKIEDIINNNVTVQNVVGFLMYFVNTDNLSTYHYVYPTGGGSELPVPEGHKTYYGDNGRVMPWRRIDTMGFFCPYSWYDVSNHYYNYFTVEKMPNASEFDDITTFNPQFSTITSLNMYNWGHVSPQNQVFDDVSYHWEVGVAPYNGFNYQDFTPWEDGHTFGETAALNIVGRLVIDDSTYNTTNEAVTAAIMHELAFIGFPVAKTASDRNASIGSNGVLLPVFDDHWITTGDFVSGSASLDLPNADWRDVFGSTMPEYDPNYNPDPEPEPDDYGYLNNKPITNRVYSSNNRVYALTAAQYSQFINDINSLYLDDPDTGYASFQLDFKGTNPSDYIVGTYGYTFLPAGLIPNQTPEAIQIGAVTLPNAEGYRIAPSYIYNYRSLGEIDLTGAGDFKPFGDFRDYEPYTHIELYVPLCGNIELDPAAVIGHTVQIDIIFDIMTGNATACVYRDNKTLIATVAGQLAASLPLTSGRMGDYQNAVKSAENALKQNELKTTTAAATVAMGVGAALLAPETGGLSLAAYGAAITGGASLMSLSNQKNQIEYEIKHKQPSISVCSSANGAVAQNISSMYAVCYVKQCKLLSSYNAATYAHTVGHATVKNTTVGAETTEGGNSLIVCSNADLSGIPATAAEINAIQSLLTGGIYV